MPQTIFITGASSGLGKATAKLFAAKGWKVIATMRKPEKETELTQLANVKLLALDVTDLAQVNSSCKTAMEDGVDIVFNNAGYGLAGPLEGATDEQIQQQLDTNLLGVIRVTKEFIPYFREKGSGVFITTTSIGGLIAFPFNTVYHATKWALEGWSESLSYELAPFGIQVKTVSPGGIKTDFFGSLVLTEHQAYSSMVDKVLKAFSDPKRQKNHSSSEQIAEIVYQAATDGKSQLRYVAGKDANMMYKMRRWFGYRFFMKQINKIFFK